MISPKGTRQKSGRKLAIRPAPSTLDLNLFVCFLGGFYRAKDDDDDPSTSAKDC